MKRPPQRITRAVAALGAAAALAGCSTHPAPPITGAALAVARSFNDFTTYWDGRYLGNVPLTAADGLSTYAPSNGFTLFYGNCERDGLLHIGGCTLPVEITTVLYVPHSNKSLGPRRNLRLRGVPAVIFDGGDEIEMYTDKMSIDIVADTPRRALAAVRALRPFNRVPTITWPAFPQPYFKPGVPPNQLPGATGASGATGTATLPSQLQPTPAAKQ
jgi:hypothetical protein